MFVVHEPAPESRVKLNPAIQSLEVTYDMSKPFGNVMT